jgi:hypothetical protein
MSYNGAGTFVINTAGQPVASGTAITATAFNALTADLATGLSTAMCKDGQSTATANLPMGGFKLTGLGNGSAATDSVALGQLQGLTASYLAVSGSTTITATASPALTGYTAGQAFWFKAAGTCSSNPTINIDGLGAKNLSNGANLAAGGLLSGLIYIIVYDGAQFLVANPSGIRTLTVTNSFSSIGSTTIGDAAGDALTINSSAASVPNNLAFDTDVLFIDAANNRVGVGTTTPSQLLSVSAPAAADAPLLLKAPSTNKSIVNFGDTASDTVGSIQYDHTVDAMIFSANAAEDMRITSAGRVGIGTNAPGQLLTVAGTIESTTGGVKFPDGTTQTTASRVLQQVSASSSAYASGTTTTPADDTIPQQTEGNEFLTVTITPKSATSTLLVEVNANCSSSAAGTMTSAIFRDLGANAIAAQGQYLAVNELFVSVVRVFVAASSTSATTFKLRVGCNNAGTVALNGVSGSRLYGGAAMSTITVTEIL